MMRSFFWHLRFLTCLVMSLILAPDLHKTFLLLCLIFLSRPFQVSFRGVTIESPTRNACFTLWVSECWSRSAENLLVNGILNYCDCAALLVRFAGGLGYVVGLLRGVGSIGCCGRGVGISGHGLPFVETCCRWCWRSCYGQVFQAVCAASATLKVLVLLLALQWMVVRVPQSLVIAVVWSHLCLLTVMSGDGGGLEC